MFCGKCGARNTDDAAFCVECGEKINMNQPKEVSTADWKNMSGDTNSKNRKVGIVTVAVFIFVLTVVAFAMFGGRSYKSTIDTWFDATFEADANAIFELIPEEMVDYMLEEDGMTRIEFREEIKEIEEDLQDQIDDIERYLGEDWEVSYSILEDEQITGKELEELKEIYEDADIKLSAARLVEIEVLVSAQDTENSNEMQIALVKIGRNWYLDLLSMGSLF